MENMDLLLNASSAPSSRIYIYIFILSVIPIKPCSPCFPFEKSWLAKSLGNLFKATQLTNGKVEAATLSRIHFTHIRTDHLLGQQYISSLGIKSN